MRQYYLVAVWKQGEVLRLTKMCEGAATELMVDVGLLPAGTIRVGVMEKREFDSLAEAQVEAAKSEIQRIVNEA